MPIETSIGQSYIINADQWQEDGYFLADNLVYSYFIDRKDPQFGIDKGRTIEDFFADPDVSNEAKAWLVELLKNI